MAEPAAVETTRIQRPAPSASSDPVAAPQSRHLEPARRYPEASQQHALRLAQQVGSQHDNFVICPEPLQLTMAALYEASTAPQARSQIDSSVLGGMGDSSAIVLKEKRQELTEMLDRVNAGAPENDPNLRITTRAALGVPVELGGVSEKYKPTAEQLGLAPLSFKRTDPSGSEGPAAVINGFLGAEVLKPSPLDANMSFALATTTDIKGKFQTPFQRTDPARKDPDTGEITYPAMLIGNGAGRYTFEVTGRPGQEGVIIPLANNGGYLYLFGVRDKADSEQLLAMLADKGVKAMVTDRQPTGPDSKVKVGACHIECDIDFRQAYEDMGVKDLMQEDSAGLSGITGEGRVWLQQFPGRASFTIGEKGFEASQQ
ncbi:MAG TPA: serpin family protein, partial [Oligoflexia bacterium]|nr:serpin family protein [Oligoflexia bacterium]